MSLKTFISDVNKTFGEGTAYIVDEGLNLKVDFIPTGKTCIDTAMGIGGFPRGRISEVFGKEGSGKTTLCFHAIARAQSEGLGAGFIDAEHAVSFERMRLLGVDTGKLVFSQPQSGEQALELVESMVRSGQFQIVVVDSVAALTPQTEIDRDMGESSMGVQARLMSQAMRKLAAPVAKHNVALVFTNQVRAQIGAYGGGSVTTGGNALKFYASMRLKMKYVGRIVDSHGDQISGKYELEVVKNKLAIPYKKANFEISEYGIDESTALIESLVESGKLTKAGNWFKMGERNLANGMQAMKEVLRTDKQVVEALGIGSI